jgi:hypothetical protein
MPVLEAYPSVFGDKVAKAEEEACSNLPWNKQE